MGYYPTQAAFANRFFVRTEPGAMVMFRTWYTPARCYSTGAKLIIPRHERFRHSFATMSLDELLAVME
jgi:hypothetical protein